MIKEIIVVEGKDDTVAIRRAVDAETIETGGSAISEVILQSIELAWQRRGVIIFTDPDHAGERIRRIISARVPGCKHAFIPRDEAVHRGKIGVEHASPAMIRKALAEVKTETVDAHEPEIRREDLLNAGLIFHPQAARRRLIVGQALGIGYANGKQFFRRCDMFRISREEFAEALKTVEDGGSGDAGRPG